MRLHEVIDDPSCPHLFLVLDFVENGVALEWDSTTQTFESKHGDVIVQGADGEDDRVLLSEDKVAVIVDDVLHGLEYLHLHHIAHR